ncbi:MAG: hypothetical protein D6733_05380 [Methanobacteriota archaeon]|nr:MAG: hypothetical protein D6733_05380 [Euryarchaeota archaeon]
MLPVEFAEFSRRFEVGFLVWIKDEAPTMRRCDFHITTEKIGITPMEYDPLRLPQAGSKVALVFANPWYTERCEMGVVRGVLQGEMDSLEIEPWEIIWSVAWDVEHYPERIIRRWRR